MGDEHYIWLTIDIQDTRAPSVFMQRIDIINIVGYFHHSIAANKVVNSTPEESLNTLTALFIT
jgi:hypothetical protein